MLGENREAGGLPYHQPGARGLGRGALCAPVGGCSAPVLTEMMMSEEGPGGRRPPLPCAGVPEDFIVYMKSLARNPIEFYSCFISYSSQDDDFARRLHADLQQSNVRCWFAPEDLKIGDKFRTRIDESIRVYDKLMVILTEHSLASPWVEEEVEAALEKEAAGQTRVLFLSLWPIRLDDAVMETHQALGGNLNRWPAPHAAYRGLPPLEGSRCVPEGLRAIAAGPEG
jgi:hypothetical protein